ncbi:MAG: response regulator transcription factor [Actinomycetota bacterium]
MTRILVVDDEESLLDAVGFALSREGYEVIPASDGIVALECFRGKAPDLVVLDLMLPGMSGWDVCREIRRSSDVPILMLTARDAEVDRVVGLEMGADDYVTKPFSMRELVARVRALLRRAGVASAVRVADSSVLEAGPVRLDSDRREVIVRGARVSLPLKEFQLLEVLMANRGKALSRDFLIESVWGYDYVGDTKTLDVHVRRLRSRIEEDPHHPKLLRTVRGFGYRLGD